MSKVRSIRRAAAQAQAKEAVITVTLGSLFTSQQALQSLAQQPMPARLTFKLVKIVRAVSKELKDLEETRIKLCDQYGTQDESGKYEFSKENEETINREFNELLKTAVKIKGEQIDLEGLPDLTISAADVIQLSWLVE